MSTYVLLTGCGPPPAIEETTLQAQAVQRVRPKVTSVPTARFDWSMPATVDADHDGAVDISPPASRLTRTLFDVTLNACGSTPSTWGGPLARFEWTIGAPANTTLSTSTCEAPIQLAQGSYPVTLKVTDVDGIAGTVESQLVVRNLLVVSMGDSNASGEGNPDAPRSNGLKWADRRCHRSALSGPARSAKALEDADSRTSVTFLSVACSGASMQVGLLNEYEGQEVLAGDSPFRLPPQVDAVRALLCSDGCPNGMRPIDAVLLNVGANDLGFGEVVKHCAVPYFGCDKICEPTPIGQSPICFPRIHNMVKSGLAALPQRYSELNERIRGQLNPRSVIIGEYFDPTWGDRLANGASNLCSKMVLKDAVPDDIVPILGYWIGRIDGYINAEEIKWARSEVVLPLNKAVAQAAETNGWKFVNGIADEFVGHGYCAKDNWVVRFDESMRSQGNESGTMHPNGAGHEVYGRRFGSALIAETLTGTRHTDMNGDGNADILWTHAATGTISPWFLEKSHRNGTTLRSNGTLSLHVTPGTWEPASLGDFDKDGKSDILYLNPGTGELTINYLNGLQVVKSKDSGIRYGLDKLRVPSSSGWKLVGTGDFDRDGNRDIFWHHAATGSTSVWLMDDEGTHFRTSAALSLQGTPNNGWTLIGTGDFDKDGHVDVLWHAPSTGELAYWRLNKFQVIESVRINQLGPTADTGWRPEGIDDYDRDGFVDILWHHGPTGQLTIWHLFKEKVSWGSTVVDVNGAILNVPDSSGWRVTSH